MDKIILTDFTVKDLINKLIKLNPDKLIYTTSMDNAPESILEIKESDDMDLIDREEGYLIIGV